MAKVIIHSLFEQKLHEYVEEAYEVYGRKTARRWMTEIDKIKSFLEVFPEGRPPFNGAPDFPYQLRGANFMNNFKLIYYYLEKMDEVHFVDIWDMRKKPIQLLETRRITYKKQKIPSYHSFDGWGFFIYFLIIFLVSPLVYFTM